MLNSFTMGWPGATRTPILWEPTPNQEISPSMSVSQARFAIGDVIHHTKFGYRGVIVDVDPVFQGSETWYRVMAKSRPPKDKPWYHVLVHDATHRTYVAERHLESDPSGGQVNHPELGAFFDTFERGRYHTRTERQ